MRLFWYFVIYSFLGFLLEVAFARLTGARKRDRKCFWLLPLCPVYGLGALAILSLPEAVRSSPWLLVLCGGLTATGVEYLMALVYEKWMGVAFWDYSGLPGSVRGRVCLPFSLAWGLLSLPLIHWVHPILSPLLRAIPAPLTWMALALVLADGLCTVVLLRRTRSTQSLRWYLGRQAH